MTRRSANGNRGGASQRAAPALPAAHNVADAINEDDVDEFRDDGESKYPPRGHGRPAPEPLKVRVELVVVDGQAGKELLKRQAAAVREALQWFADHPPDEEEGDTPHEHKSPAHNR
ncbi:hypothetical protein Drose_16995 [Dactylosporangium roseum]|uniref:Uncharacterized protein n=1 Tax=Dactylosporangium roseum TaxID=47989 RepID=A0ABY5ZHM9_9ACTN|nr:hypothetical protein [Dactylosporangium roseum]UWZ39764.1 hypothetical protein Drose_16995 [Dactylosporangium roseum]